MYILPSPTAADSSRRVRRLLQILVKKLKWIPCGESHEWCGSPRTPSSTLFFLILLLPLVSVLCLFHFCCRGRHGKATNDISFGAFVEEATSLLSVRMCNVSCMLRRCRGTCNWTNVPSNPCEKARVDTVYRLSWFILEVKGAKERCGWNSTEALEKSEDLSRTICFQEAHKQKQIYPVPIEMTFDEKNHKNGILF